MYDIIVIGAGSGGLNIAMFMHKAGFKVLLIDKSEASIGGDCLNFGCVPSKAIIHLARLVKNAQEVKRFGLETSGKIDIQKVTAYIKEKQSIIRKHENAAHFRSLGIDVVLGKATFTSPNKVKVEKELYEGKKVVIATGSRPRMLTVPGGEKIPTFTNETIFDIDFLPKQMVVVGGGPIGIELGQVFLRLGVKVIVVNNNKGILPKEHPKIASILMKRLQEEGMHFIEESYVHEVVDKRHLIVENKKTKKRSKVPCDAILVAIGRQLNYEQLGLENAGIKTTEKGIWCNEQLQTTNKNVFLCGDIAGSYQFTHAAELHAGLLLNNFFSPLKKKLNNDHLSWVTYTDPEIATFGLNEEQLKERKVEYETLELDFDYDDRAIVDETTYGKAIVYVSKNKLLGGTMIGKNAGELFQELVLANTAKLDIKHLFNKTYPYPTATRVNKRLITNHFAKKLTPFAKKVLHFLYR